MAAGAFALVVSEFLGVGLLPDIAGGLHVSDGTAGLMVTAPGLVAALSAPLITVLAARVDRRTVLASLTGLLVVSNLLAALAPDFTVLMVARLLLGVGVGGFWSVGVSVTPRIVRLADVARASSLVASGITAATVVSLPLGALVGRFLGWRAAFLIAAAFSLVVLVAQLVFLPSVPGHARTGFASLLHIFRVPRARAGVLASVALFFGHFTGYTYLVPALHGLSPISDGMISPMLCLFGAAGLIGTFGAGLTLTRRPLGTLVAGVVLLGASIILMPMAGTTVPGAITLAALWGLGWGVVPVSLQLRISRAMGERADGGLALFVSASQLSLAAGSFVGGIIVDSAGIATGLVTGGLAALLALAPLSGTRPDRPSEA
jgi:predicted MFS family arabinose efflux permease